MSNSEGNTKNDYSGKKLGIRREDKGRWERRAPLAPRHVKELVKQGSNVVIQPSNLRTYHDNAYKEVCYFQKCIH